MTSFQLHRILVLHNYFNLYVVSYVCFSILLYHQLFFYYGPVSFDIIKQLYRG